MVLRVRKSRKYHTESLLAGTKVVRGSERPGAPRARRTRPGSACTSLAFCRSRSAGSREAARPAPRLWGSCSRGWTTTLMGSLGRATRRPPLARSACSEAQRTEKIESVTFPCLNQTGEGSRFRFFALRVEFKRMGESDSVAIVARAIASSPWQAPAPSARRIAGPGMQFAAP